MVKVITVKVSKGGVGKTTISSNLAYSLSQDYKVLLIDLDSQSNLSNIFARDINDELLTSSNLLGDDDINFENIICKIKDNLDLIVSDIGLHEVSKYLENKGKYYDRLNDVIENSILKDYDFIILDLSPGVADTLTEIALCTSDLLVCPMHFDTDSLAGLVHTINDISRLSDANILKKELNYLVVPNRYDLRFEKDNKAIIQMIYDNLDKEFSLIGSAINSLSKLS
jgi:cellulose biosynthesis protein BcsQ